MSTHPDTRTANPPKLGRRAVPEVNVDSRGTGTEWSEPLARAWETRRDAVFERHRRVSEWLVEQIAPRPGQVILELAAGTGDTGFLAAERIGPTGKLLSTDITTGMVEAARRGAKARGLSNVECQVIDAQDIRLANDSVDGVLCRFALMLLPEPERAVCEIRRVLRPGGRVAYAVFGAAKGNPWITLLAEAIRRCGHEIPADPFGLDGRFFSLANPERNQQMLTNAGFSEVTIDEISQPRKYRDFEEYWDHHSHATERIAQLVDNLSADQSRQIQLTLQPLLAPFRNDAKYWIPSNVIVVGAR